MLEDIWDWIVESFFYLVSFEWLGDVWEIISSLFENIGEFSIFGLAFGILSAGFVFILRDYMLNPFLLHMGSLEATFWGVATYAVCFIGGYILGRHFDDN